VSRNSSRLVVVDFDFDFDFDFDLDRLVKAATALAP